MARFPRSSVIFHVVRSVGRLVPILGAIALATSIVAAAGKLPAVDGDQGDDYVGKPAGYGKMVRDRYTTEDYHRPSDEVKPYWEVAGAVDDAELLLDVGSRVADAATRPEWKPGNEFRRIREESLRNSQSK